MVACWYCSPSLHAAACLLGMSSQIQVTEQVETVLVLEPSLVSRVDLPGLASSNISSKQQQQASTHEMGENQNSVVVVRIRPKFWWMIPMGVKNNQTKFKLNDGGRNGCCKWQT